MYDEFERAMTGKPKRSGLSFLAWAGIVVGVMLILGVVGIVWAVKRAVEHTVAQVEEVAREIGRGDLDPSVAAAEMVGRLRSHAELVHADPEEGLAFLESLDAGDPSEAFVQNLVEGAFRFRTGAGEVSGEAQGDEDGGFLTVRSDEGTVRMDLTRHEDGGSLVIDTDDGQVRFDLMRTDDGGFLTIDSEEGSVRFNLRKTDHGGVLTIDSDDAERVRFDLRGGDGGGRLLISTDDESLRFGLGDDAAGMPRWVPRTADMPRRPTPVYSLDSGEGFLGAVAWESDESPEQVLAYYQEVLEADGFELRAAHRIRDGDEDGGSLWARNEAFDRMVFVVVRRDHDRSGVLLGYGEGS